MSLGRTFSFDHNDERALSSNEQERLSYSYQASPYRDSPARDIVSPPPLYSSPPPQEPVTPISPSPPPSQSYNPNYSPGLPSSQAARPTAAPARKPVPQFSDDEDLPPPPPPHRINRTSVGGYSEPEYRYSTSPSPPIATQDMIYAGDAARGPDVGMAAMGAADRYHRGRRAESSRDLETSQPQPSHLPVEGDFDSHSRGQQSNRYDDRSSNASNLPLTAGAVRPGSITPRGSPYPRSSAYSGRSIPLDEYRSPYYASPYNAFIDSPYQNSSLTHNPALSEASINPYTIADDGDDGFMQDPVKHSMRHKIRQRSGEHASNEPTVAAGAAAGGISGLFGRKPKAAVSSGSYDAVRQSGAPDGEGPGSGREKSEWLARQTQGNNRMRWVVGGAIITVVILAVIGGIVGGVLASRKSSTGSSSSSDGSDNTASGDLAANGDLDSNSPEIQALMNNPNLHKVFPGIDYTPWGTQYPDCFTWPPSPNNVTRDMAVLSQLTNAVRLYGNDCNQTQMVLHSIDRLGLTDMKVWLGVWVDVNDTTTERQLAQMYTIIESTPDLSIYKGAIIGNEALYRAGLDKASSETQLIQILTDVKANFTARGWDIPVATSDLGDNWNGPLVDAVDIVMSNIHPFFAGVNPDVASAWTINFWDTHDLVLTGAGTGVNSGKRQIISETGWPSAGGTDCGGTTGECAAGQAGAVASVDGMNTYMNDFVCQAMANGTEYFWFEAFDEVWKQIYDTGDQDWETEWGLMDSGRNIKNGLKIPDCGGKTVS